MPLVLPPTPACTKEIPSTLFHMVVAARSMDANRVSKWTSIHLESLTTVQQIAPPSGTLHQPLAKFAKTHLLKELHHQETHHQETPDTRWVNVMQMAMKVAKLEGAHQRMVVIVNELRPSSKAAEFLQLHNSLVTSALAQHGVAPREAV